VDVVGHNNALIQMHALAHLTGSMPFIFYNLSKCTQHDFPFHDLPKQTFPVMGAHRYKIDSRLAIIVFLQPNGTAMTFLRIIHPSYRTI
jgi:hypothetical protein